MIKKVILLFILIYGIQLGGQSGNRTATNSVGLSHYSVNPQLPFHYSTASGKVGVTNFAEIDSDGDGIPDSYDLDDDNDGILDKDENSTCGVPPPTIAPGNGVLIHYLFNENFGTMSTANGTTSVNMAALGTGANTTYNYYAAVLGTTPSNTADGSGPPNSLQDGRYTIFNNIRNTASWANSIWQNIGDRTNGGTTPTSGRMFIANASTAAGEFYRKTLTNVIQGAPINASLWAMNLDLNISSNNSRNLPNITVRFIQSGSIIYSFNTGDIARYNAGDVNAWNFFKSPTVFFSSLW